MNDQHLQEISNAYSDAEKIRLIIQYLQEVTGELKAVKDRISFLTDPDKATHAGISNNATTLQSINEMVEIHSSTIQSISDHLTSLDSHLETHDRHLEAHDRHLQSLGDHLKTLTQR